MVEMLKGKLTSQFKMTGMGDVSLVLGIQLSRNLEQGGTDDYPSQLHEGSVGEAWDGHLKMPGAGLGAFPRSAGRENPGFGDEAAVNQDITGYLMHLAQVTKAGQPVCRQTN